MDLPAPSDMARRHEGRPVVGPVTFIFHLSSFNFHHSSFILEHRRSGREKDE